MLRQESESERLARPARRGAQGAIHANLFQRSPDKRRGGKDVEHLMVRTLADWTVTLRPVGHTQRVESFRARLVEPTPETKARALDSEAASMVHWHRRQPTASATRDTVGQRPLSTAGLKTRTDSQVRVGSGVRAAARGTVDALGHQSEAGDLIRQAVHGPAEAPAAARDSSSSQRCVVAKEAVPAADVHGEDERLKRQRAAERFVERLPTNIPPLRPRAHKEQVPKNCLRGLQVLPTNQRGPAERR